MRLTEFHELVDAQFGSVRGVSLLWTYVLTAWGSGPPTGHRGRRGPDVWRALYCADLTSRATSGELLGAFWR